MSNVITRGGQLILLTAEDVGKYIRIEDPEHVRVRVDTFGSIPGSEIYLEHLCMKSVVIDLCVGATVRVMERFYPEILGMYGVVTLKCVAPDEWVMFGALIPKPKWQTTIDYGLGLNYDLTPVVDIDWAVQLAELEAALGSLETPTSATVVCVVSP